VCVYVLTHTIAALVTVIVVIEVEGDCNGNGRNGSGRNGRRS
jgi:hypothetical protein